MNDTISTSEFDEWNPGLTSDIPSALLPKVTLFDPNNSHVDYEGAKSASEICGLKPHELNAFTVSRLAVHETLIRVTADLYVADGPNYEDLGISLRGMTGKIMEGYILPNLTHLEKEFSAIRQEVSNRLNEIVDRDLYPSAPATSAKQRNFLSGILGRNKKGKSVVKPDEFKVIAQWQKQLDGQLEPLDHACLEGLCRIVGGVLGLRGRLAGDREQIVGLAVNWICNSYGSLKLGELIEPYIRQAVESEGYKFLPFQAKPFVMNVKGASAAGKSTLRPMQKNLAERLELNWSDFALLSTDYWRKYLLEYESIGDHYKYAAMLTGQELEVIDKKLDRHIGLKAKHNKLPHMLIDRFRFDSFSADMQQDTTTGLLSRFGDTVYLFFVITPPTETVKRAWFRGRKTGRYKSVDDLLYHNIEANKGIPQMFIRWSQKTNQKIHFEFLDNSVDLNEQPRTVAFGWNNRLIVLNPEFMRVFQKYSSININAKKPEEVYNEVDSNRNSFLNECVRKLKDVIFVDSKSLEIMGHIHQGRCDYERDGFFASTGIETTDRKTDSNQSKNSGEFSELPGIDLEMERLHTVGSWGSKE